MKKIISILRNRYLLATLIVGVWMTFFDRDDIFTQYEYYKAVWKLQEKKAFYQHEIAQVKRDIAELHSNKDRLEKFAREKYFMKRENEDIFVVVEQKEE